MQQDLAARQGRRDTPFLKSEEWPFEDRVLDGAENGALQR
jgi:hypothetical protein